MNALPLSLLTALRFSKGRKRAGMVSLISVISTLGLSLIHISEPTRQAEISYAVFCLKKKKPTSYTPPHPPPTTL